MLKEQAGDSHCPRAVRERQDATQHKELWDLHSVLKRVCIQCAAPVVKYHTHYGSKTPLNCLWFLVHLPHLQESKAFENQEDLFIELKNL